MAGGKEKAQEEVKIRVCCQCRNDVNASPGPASSSECNHELFRASIVYFNTKAEEPYAKS
jgi:hypothetical protein